MRQPAEVGIAGAEGELEVGRRGCGVRAGGAGELHPGDDRAHRHLQPALLQLDMQECVADVTGQAEPALHPEGHIHVGGRKLLQTEGGAGEVPVEVAQAARRCGAVLGLFSHKRAQVERRQQQLAADPRAFAAVVEVELADQCCTAHYAGELDQRDLARRIVKAAGHGARPHVRKLRLKQALELREALRAETEGDLAAVSTDVAFKRKGRAEESKHHFHRPGPVEGDVGESSSGKLDPVRETFLDCAFERHRESLAGWRLGLK